jgi:CubicO group peptidase (beta-lactamase class C family)
MPTALRATLSGTFAISFVVCLSGCGGEGGTTPQGGFAATVTRIINEARAAPDLPPSICVAIGRAGVPVYKHCVGYSDLEHETRARPSTVYQIGSLTKQFTATAIMKLANAEPPMLSLEDQLADYFPQTGSHPPITIRNLLNHSAGLVNYAELDECQDWGLYGVTPEVFIETMAPKAQVFTPGTAFQYSDTNYCFLGLTIELVTGNSFGGFLRQNLFVPYGLDNTAYGPSAWGANASGYKVDAVQGVVPAESVELSATFASGALSSNVLDLVKWDWLLLGGTIVPPSVVQQMITPPAIPEYETTNPSHYGFGLFNVDYNGRQLVYHSGAVSGFYSFDATFTDTAWSLAIVSNIDSDTYPDILKLGDAIINAVCAPGSKYVHDC